MPNKYMHTLCGHPAYFAVDEQMIFYAKNGTHFSEMFVDSLEEIRNEQAESAATRMRDGMSDHSKDYGYMRFKV